MTETAQSEPGIPRKTAKWAGRPWRFVLLVVVFMAVIVVAGRLRHGNPDLDLVGWRGSYDSAVVEAREADKPLLVVFGADWCGPCEQMKAHVFSDKQVADTIEAGFVPLRVDLTENGGPNDSLARRYGVSGIPALYVLDAEGTPVSRSVGYLSKADLLAWLDRADARHTDLNSPASLADPAVLADDGLGD